MPSVLLQISYDIKQEKRDDYLALAGEMKAHFTEVRKKQYTIFELKGKKNSFVEEFTCQSMEEYDALEDNLDEKSESLVSRLDPLIQGKARYSTLIEVA